jgi:hypothetical protein
MDAGTIWNMSTSQLQERIKDDREFISKYVASMDKKLPKHSDIVKKIKFYFRLRAEVLMDLRDEVLSKL